MKPFAPIQRILCAFAMLAVLIGPVGVTMAEAAMASSGSITTTVMDGMSGMSADEEAMAEMPCCPDELPAKPDCGTSCPLAVLCSSILLGQTTATDGLPVTFAAGLSFSFQHDGHIASALVEPLPRPPRA
ncbi:hypothetical protein GOL26_28650 [Sinorhizobium medicae]|nr:hypothetical protein [Sinorhizobium medicae]MDX0998843.1 hypothetical protein [Sinorhizobium medicae]MDX1182788.1 hypothetical protein [Sinorhizobium medicae]